MMSQLGAQIEAVELERNRLRTAILISDDCPILNNRLYSAIDKLTSGLDEAYAQRNKLEAEAGSAGVGQAGVHVRE